MKKLFLFLSVAMVWGCSMPARTVDPQLAAAVEALVESREYAVDVDIITPQRGMPHTLSYPWNIRVRGDMLYSYLPYFGQAYTPIIGLNEGLDFDARINDYTVERGRRGQIEVTFWVMSSDDRYDYALTIYPSGEVSLTVLPDRKTSVRFDGKLHME